MEQTPIKRNRRLRSSEGVRKLVRETALDVSDLIYPLFVVEGAGIKREVPSMKEVYQMSVDNVVKECELLCELGVLGVILFGIPSFKDELGSSAHLEDGVIQRAVAEIKSRCPSLIVITDVCLCEYTSHGHCGVITDGIVDNDRTLPILSMEALSHAKAGADIVAPSDMMDGRVRHMRQTLDVNGFCNVPILSYAVKYASAYYGPFRDAAMSAPSFGDRRTYQMDYANRREAIREALSDIDEGADIVMVKPALAYLDIVREIKDVVNVPLGAYNVSGEYSMIIQAEAASLIDGDSVIMETLTSMKRAGADIIFTYFAKRAAATLLR